MNRVSGTSHSNNPANAMMRAQTERVMAAIDVNRGGAMRIGLHG